MRTVATILMLTACSNAANPSADAAFHPIDAAADAGEPDGQVALRILVINEVAPGETPDWFEIVNVSGAPVQLEQFVYCDVPDDFVKAKAFDAITLQAGGYHTQDVDDTISGFKLGSDEELWLYRAADHGLSDSVDWPQGAAPLGMSYARVPDATGPFVTGAPSKGLPNP